MFRTKPVNVLDLCNKYLSVATYLYKLFPEFVFFIIFFSFLFKNFTIGDEPLPNFNFDYNTINRNFNRTYYIDIYEKYFFKHETLRINLQNRQITLHSKKYLNFWSMEGFYTLCTDFHWIQVAAIVLLITTEIYVLMLKKKVSLKIKLMLLFIYSVYLFASP